MHALGYRLAPQKLEASPVAAVSSSSEVIRERRANCVLLASGATKALLPYWEHDSVQVMRIIARKSLKLFWEAHPDAEQPLKAWFETVQKADWDTPQAVKADYRSASILEDNRICFNIGGNKYRLIAKINYPYRVVYIRFIGTHAEYDRIDVMTI